MGWVGQHSVLGDIWGGWGSTLCYVIYGVVGAALCVM